MTINLTDLMGGGVRVIDAQIFTVSGNWNKPVAGLPDDDVLIQVFGAGGGGYNGGSGAGGGGGALGEFRCKLRDLAAVIAVVVASGAVAGTAGGFSTFGSLRCNGGAVGLVGSPGAGGTPGSGFDRSFDGGAGNRTASAIDAVAPAGGTFTGTGGKSLLGGDGGAANTPGSIPGGGGGSQAAGARGEVRVFVTRG